MLQSPRAERCEAGSAKMAKLITKLIHVSFAGSHNCKIMSWLARLIPKAKSQWQVLSNAKMHPGKHCGDTAAERLRPIKSNLAGGRPDPDLQCQKTAQTAWNQGQGKRSILKGASSSPRPARIFILYFHTVGEAPLLPAMVDPSASSFDSACRRTLAGVGAACRYGSRKCQQVMGNDLPGSEQTE